MGEPVDVSAMKLKVRTMFKSNLDAAFAFGGKAHCVLPGSFPPFPKYEEECGKLPKCMEIKKKVDVCEEHVKGKEGKNCLYHHARYWECVDHCVCTLLCKPM